MLTTTSKKQRREYKDGLVEGRAKLEMPILETDRPASDTEPLMEINSATFVAMPLPEFNAATSVTMPMPEVSVVTSDTMPRIEVNRATSNAWGLMSGPQGPAWFRPTEDNHSGELLGAPTLVTVKLETQPTLTLKADTISSPPHPMSLTKLATYAAVRTLDGMLTSCLRPLSADTLGYMLYREGTVTLL